MPHDWRTSAASRYLCKVVLIREGERGIKAAERSRVLARRRRGWRAAGVAIRVLAGARGRRDIEDIYQQVAILTES